MYGEIETSIVILGDFNTPLSTSEKKEVGRKISDDLEELQSIVNQQNLKDMCRTLHPTTPDYMFSIASGTHTISCTINQTLKYLK